METNVQFPDNLQIENQEEPPLVGGGELAQLWEADAIFEAMLLEEERKQDSGLPEWVRLLF